MTTLDTHILSETASTKRPPALSGGKRGDPVENVSSLNCAPLAPVDSDTKHRLEIRTPYQVFVTYVAGSVDVQEGDTFVKGSVEYPIVRCEDWSFGGFSYKALYIEELRR